MKNYRLYRFSFFCLLFTLLLVDSRYDVPFWLYLLLALVYIVGLICGSYFIQSGLFIKALWHGNRQRKAVALTFDDGPQSGFTEQILDILKKENVKATFFVIGKNAATENSLLKRIDDEGHVIGNHSYEHNYWYSLKQPAAMSSDIAQCNEVVYSITGKKPRLFRPPYGVTNPWVAKAVSEANYSCIGWSIRSYDTNIKSKEALIEKCTRNIVNGDIILLHDWAPYTASALPAIIEHIKKQGFEILRIDELLNEPAYV